MSTIKCICIDQALAFENTPVIASGSLENHVSFTFCSKWTGYTKTAVFWRNEADAYHVILDSTGTCQLPPEVSDDQGTIFFGVFGVNGAKKQRTSNVLTYRIEKGAITVATAPSDPTPDIYTQLLAMERAFETHIEQLVVNGLVPDNSMTTPKLQDGIITAPKLAAESVATDKLQDSGVTTPKLADGGVTTPKLADGSVTGEKMADRSIEPGKLSAEFLEYIKLIDGIPHMAFGSYHGDGNSGEEYPNTLTFDFEPALVVITVNARATLDGGAVFIRGQTASSGMGHVSSGAYALELAVNWDGNTVSWYHNSQADNQMNASTRTYFYFAIGRKAVEQGGAE